MTTASGTSITGPKGRRVQAGRPRIAARLAIGAACAVILVTGCSLDGLLKSDELPPEVTDPAITQTPEGALAAYHGTLVAFRRAFGGEGSSGNTMGDAFPVFTGLLTDELRGTSDVSSGTLTGADIRVLPVGGSQSDPIYGNLHRVRAQAGQAIGLLTHYRPAEPALAGHAYALQGYAEIFLAELFCSGIPLSTVDFGGDYTYQPGSSTVEVFEHAVALFDTALTLAGDSAGVMDLARVGRARALLALGSYAAAATAVAPVLDTYAYPVGFTAEDGQNARNFGNVRDGGLWDFTVADLEGGNGLAYRTRDPRTLVTLQGANTFGIDVYHPDKYATDGSSPIVLASGVEARLIEAEAALQADDATTWLTKLNQLRQTVGLTDTTDPGASLSDPAAADSARVDLLFRERAFWLFLTGHRQGDLRRLIRQYGRSQDAVYPTDFYGGGHSYGSDVTAPIPTQEQTLNPLSTGCVSRGA